MVRHLVDLESPYDATVYRSYDERDLIRYALGTTDYWAERAMGWLEQGVAGVGLDDALLALETQGARPQSLRHHARRLRKSL